MVATTVLPPCSEYKIESHTKRRHPCTKNQTNPTTRANGRLSFFRSTVSEQTIEPHTHPTSPQEAERSVPCHTKPEWETGSEPSPDVVHKINEQNGLLSMSDACDNRAAQSAPPTARAQWPSSQRPVSLFFPAWNTLSQDS